MKIEGIDILKELFAYACKQDKSAIQYCISIWRICHFWDDLIDCDPVTDEETNNAFTAAMVEINSNPFFIKNRSALNGMVSLIISNWHVANEYEANKQNIEKAYMLRAQLYNLPVMCAFLIGGQGWANQVAKNSWDFYGESFNDFQSEVNNA
jgi:hypothetical protein